MGVAISNNWKYGQRHGGRYSEQLKIKKKAWGSHFREIENAGKGMGVAIPNRLNSEKSTRVAILNNWKLHIVAWGSRFRTIIIYSLKHRGVAMVAFFGIFSCSESRPCIFLNFFVVRNPDPHAVFVNLFCSEERPPYHFVRFFLFGIANPMPFCAIYSVRNRDPLPYSVF